MPISIGDALVTMGVDKTDFDASMREMQEHVKSSMEKIQGALRVGGAAFTAVGVAGLKVVSDARALNAQLGQTAITLGLTTKDMRDLALETTNVTFPLASVTKTFELLAKAGVKNVDQMKANANAFDALADATGSSAEIVADMLLPAFKLFGQEIPTTSAELDKFTWLTKNTLVDLSDFGTLLNRMGPYMDQLNMSMDDSIAILAALSEKGITGTAATLKLRTAITQAASGAVTLNEALGLTQDEIDGFKKKMSEATGITDKYAEAANKQYGLMDKLKQKYSELALQVGSLIEPMEPLLGLMTALGPMMLFFSTSMGVTTVKMIAGTAATIAHTVAVGAQAAVIGIATAAQWAWNVAMTANPIGLIIVGIAALITAIILLVKNWDTVKEKTIEVWNIVVTYLKGVWENIVSFFSANWDKILAILFPAVGLPILIARNWGAIVEVVRNIWDTTVEWLAGVPPRIGAIFATVTDWILTPFRAAIQGIQTGINWLIQQINRISFTIPDWVPGIGGQSWGLNIPPISLPKFAQGGVIPEPTLLYGLRSMRPYAVAGEAGIEHVVPDRQAGYRTANIYFQVDGKTLAQVVGQPLVDIIRVRQGLKI